MGTVATSAERSPSINESCNERCLVAAEALCQSGQLRLRVQGESMLPALWPGDIVQVASCSIADVEPGDIVLAMRDNRFFLHRFTALCSGNALLLRGDSMPGHDPLLPSEALLGRLVEVVKPRFALATRRGLGAKLSRAFGLLLCHFRTARRLALKLHRAQTVSRLDLPFLETAHD